MLSDHINQASRIHSRTIELATYPIENAQVIVHGVLKDYRYVRVFDAAGAIKEPGIVHHIEARLLISSNPLVIEEAEAEMVVVPIDECRQAIENIKHLIGEQVRSGFSKQVRSVVGGTRGCNHLSQLIVSMGQEIVSGWLTRKRRDRPTLPKNMESFQEKDYILDSCLMWSKEGPRYNNLVKAIQANQE
jgi:hypothetical protein